VNKNRICLGTVNFGLAYGPESRKLSYDEVKSLLNYSREIGVEYFDTARGYGNSEKLLGEFVGLVEPSNIVSKLSLRDLNTVEEVLKELRDSLQRLKRKSINCVLLHDTEAALTDVRKIKLFQHSMLVAIETGLIKTFGYSVYSLDEIQQLGEYDYPISNLQVPENILDRRLINSEPMSQLNKDGCTIFVRSLFLQGYLSNSQIDNHSRGEMGVFLECFRLACLELGLSPSKVSLAYFNSIEWAKYAVIGCDSRSQLKDNYETLNTVVLPEDFYVSLPQLPLHLVDPRRWS
jgi:aryl-alcohol dehydrogenase-like predicted oxidoreductase